LHPLAFILHTYGKWGYSNEGSGYGLRVMTSYSDVVGYLHFISLGWYPATSQHGVITQNTMTWMLDRGQYPEIELTLAICKYCTA
jgi:hypothetical protein